MYPEHCPWRSWKGRKFKERHCVKSYKLSKDSKRCLSTKFSFCTLLSLLNIKLKKYQKICHILLGYGMLLYSRQIDGGLPIWFSYLFSKIYAECDYLVDSLKPHLLVSISAFAIGFISPHNKLIRRFYKIGRRPRPFKLVYVMKFPCFSTGQRILLFVPLPLLGAYGF